MRRVFNTWEKCGCSFTKALALSCEPLNMLLYSSARFVLHALRIASTPISVVYFRSGYTPNDYPTEREWKGREIVEQSSAAKCPSVAYQLAGSKKVQQELAKQGTILVSCCPIICQVCM